MFSKIRSCLVVLAAFSSLVRAEDTTPPTLDVTQAWIEKVGAVYHFKLMLDPWDETGLPASPLEFRSKLNTTAALAANTPWLEYPWQRGEPMDLAFNCTAIVIEVRVKDAAGHYSPLQRRTFQAPFPLSTPPNVYPKFSTPQAFSGAAMDTRGLFTADFDGQGLDDVLQIDRTSGTVLVRRQGSGGTFTDNSFTLTPNSIEDSAVADFDGDGRTDIAVVVDHTVILCHNDGLDGDGVLKFSQSALPAIIGSGLTVVSHVVSVDANGDGKADLALSGTNGSGNAQLTVLINNGTGQLSTSNSAMVPSGASAGPLAVGNITGDGHADVVMINAAGKKLVVFKNKGDGTLAGADDADEALRPTQYSTGLSFFPIAADALAVGDVTGDGRPDVVLTVKENAYQGQDHYRETVYWQLFDNRGDSALMARDLYQIGRGPETGNDAAPTFPTSVLLQDLNGDRFPEMVFTNPFETGTGAQPAGGIQVVRMTPQLDTQNLLKTSALSFTQTGYATGVANPGRLASGVFGAGPKRDILIANNSTTPLLWLFNAYKTYSKPLDLEGGASTDSDPNGTLGSTGIASYHADIGDKINYTLTYTNDRDPSVAANNLTNATVECTLPAGVVFDSADEGGTQVTVGAVKYVRWIVPSIPAGTAGVKSFSVRASTGKVGAVIAPTAYFRNGTQTLVTTAMPKVTLDEPLKLKLTASTDTDFFVGLRSHMGELITYKMKVTNQSSATVSGFKLSMSIPANTVFDNSPTSPTPTYTGKAPAYTSATWTNQSLAAGEDKTYVITVRAKNPLANGTIIKNSTVTVTRSDNTKLVAPVLSTAIEPPLEITLSSDKNIVRPGEVIRYTLTARNWLSQSLADAKVVNVIPLGFVVHRVAIFDGVDAPYGKGNYNQWPGLPGSSLTSTTFPSLFREAGLLTWPLGIIPAGAIRTIEFEVLVQQDVPSSAYLAGVSTTLAMTNSKYNFSGYPGTGSYLFAAPPALPVAAINVNTPPLLLVATTLPAKRSLLSDPPLAPCNLTLTKSANADGVQTIAGERIYSVVNDATVSNDGVFDYVLRVDNLKLNPADPTPGTAANVVIREYLPDGVNFLGFVARDGSLVPSYLNYHFRNLVGAEIPPTGESFTDKNGNGVWNAGEPFVDANQNHKRDGTTDIRRIDFPVGDLAGGQSVTFTYRVQTTKAAGATLISNAGGTTGVKDGLSYTLVDGYHLRADNLNFPVNGGPKQTKVLVTAPATFTFPVQAVKSRSDLVDGQSLGVSIPYEVQGAEGLTLSGIKMELPIPKGYRIDGAQVFNTAGQEVKKYVPGGSGNTITVAAADAAGVRKVTFPLDGMRRAFPMIKLALDQATKSVLKNAQGQTKAPLLLKPTMTGQYLKPVAAPPAAAAFARGASPLATAPAPIPLAAATLISPVPVLTDPTKDSKIFVGRCAPLSVRRGETFSYTIFVGNLTERNLGKGTLEMSVPAGCDFVSASLYTFNGISDGVENGGPFLGSKAVRSGTKVTWNVGSFFKLEGGAVTLTLKVRDDFSGTRIDDNSCTFDVVNASGKTPGPLGIMVRTGNEATQTAEIVQGAAQGLQLQYNEGVRAGLMNNFSFTTSSCIITCGGADQLQLNNGTLVIQMPGRRALVAGPPNKVVSSGIRQVKGGESDIVEVAVGSSANIELTRLPSLASNVVMTASTILDNLHIAGSSFVGGGLANLVAAGAGNMIAAGGGNLVGTDAASLVGQDGASLVGQDGGTFSNIASLVAAGGGNLVGTDGASLVGAGAGNIIAAGGGNVLAVGAGSLIGTDGASLVGTDGGSLVAAGAGNLVGQDGASLVAAGAGNIFSTNSGNLIQGSGLVTSPNKF